MALTLGNPNLSGNPAFVRRTGWLLLWCLLPYYALAIVDGLFLPVLLRNPLLFSTYDIAKFVLIPGAVLLYLYRVLHIRPADYLFAGLRNDLRGWELAVITFWWAFALYVVYRLGNLIVMLPLALMLAPLNWALSQWLELPKLTLQYASEFGYAMALPDNAILRALVVIFFSVTAGVVEEIFFRGLLRQATAALLGPSAVKTYIVGSALIFGLAHWEQGSTGLYNATAFGLGAAWLFLKLGDLRPLILAHTVIDLYIFW